MSVKYQLTHLNITQIIKFSKAIDFRDWVIG